MTHGVAVVSLDVAGGVQLGAQQAPWNLEGDVIVVVGDAVQGHPPAPPHTPSPVMATGSTWMTINGIPVCREGNVASCGHATSGRAWFTLPD